MNENSKTILNLLLTKSALKQDISEDTVEVFKQFRQQVKEELGTLKMEISDERIRCHLVERSEFEFHVYIGSDVLVFQMHSNVFKLPEGHPLWESAYLTKDSMKGFFGMIHIYNFLAESFIQNRFNDEGYLIGRMFVNCDRHFLVEGKGQLGFLFKNIENGVLTPETIRHIIQVSFAYALDFDLYIPPYELIQMLSVGQVQAIGSELQVSTGKRMGFKFQAEEGETF